MKRIFSFTEGMVPDSYSSLEVGEAPNASWIFWENGIKLCFLKPFQPIACFLYFYLIFFFAIKLWNGGFAIEEFFLIYRDYAGTKGSDDLPDFLKEKLFLWIMRMFSKLSEMTILIPFLFYVICIRNFGDSGYLVLKIIVLVQIQGIQVLKSPSTLANT